MTLFSSLRYLSSGSHFHFKRQYRFYNILALLVVLYIPTVLFFIPPASFPTDAYITVPDGASTGEVGELLFSRGLIESPFLFKVVFRVLGSDDSLQAGNYLFPERMGLIPLASRLISGETGIDAVRITIPEGLTTYQIAVLCEEKLPLCDTASFTMLSKDLEGYLFPDTYVMREDATAKDLIERMRANFYHRIHELQPEIDAFGTRFESILTMASLVEREGRNEEERSIIAGILWKRLKADMPLQVDAVFGYIHNRETFHPSLDDLEIDSPYNTYKYRGLPPTPIANPGLESLRSTLNPTETDYWYYLTGDDGVTYYARTFEEHKENRAKYLD